MRQSFFTLFTTTIVMTTLLHTSVMAQEAPPQDNAMQLKEVNPFADNIQNAALQRPTTTPHTTTKTVSKTPNQFHIAVNQNVALPFGYNLFQKLSPQSDKTGISPNYKIVAGDRIKLNIWGAFSNEAMLTVDTQGNIFIPEVGPVHVAGVSASRINQVIQSKIRTVYQDTVDIYINLEDRVPVSVFVTGHVTSPGRYAGNPGDSLVDYLLRAGGINSDTGSYRFIDIKRRNKTIETFDLYQFLTQGTLPKTTLQEGDSIIVKPKALAVTVHIPNQQALAYELPFKHMGETVLHYTQLGSSITHALVTGTRNSQPFNRYVTLQELKTLPLSDDDTIIFEAGTHSQNFNIRISGEHLGAKTMAIPRDARLHEVLDNIPINPLLARSDAVYLKRLSVAQKQKKSIQDSIKRLQETLLLARPSGNATEATISQGELQLLEKFMARTEALQPEGRVVVVGRRDILDIALEPNDEIVIPLRSDLISVNGEVILPQAIAWNKQDDLMDYIQRSGGFSDNANTDKILVIRANGETEVGRNVTILPGDEIIIMPEVKVNNLQLASAIADIIYKAVLAVAIPINLNN
ncbi:MAG: protein involved in polysaccharide export with SLBB domain [Alphaproteobacteria bacterium]|jgi:protein involved in polysaccharide export with SLBB domain